VGSGGWLAVPTPGLDDDLLQKFSRARLVLTRLWAHWTRWAWNFTESLVPFWGPIWTIYTEAPTIRAADGGPHSQKGSLEADIGRSLAKVFMERAVLMVSGFELAPRPGIFAVLNQYLTSKKWMCRWLGGNWLEFWARAGRLVHMSWAPNPLGTLPFLLALLSSMHFRRNIVALLVAMRGLISSKLLCYCAKWGAWSFSLSRLVVCSQKRFIHSFSFVSTSSSLWRPLIFWFERF